MREIIYATQNDAKIKTLQTLLGKGFNVKGLGDFDIKSQADEDSLTSKENALKKARYCYSKLKLPCFAMDFAFYINELRADKQPGPNVKKIVREYIGHEPNDDEVLDYYIKLVKNLGGKVSAYWLRALAFVNSNGEFNEEIKIPKVLVSTPSKKRIKGYPMTSIQIDPVFKKYESEMTDEEKAQSMKTSNDVMVSFVERCLHVNQPNKV